MYKPTLVALAFMICQVYSDTAEVTPSVVPIISESISLEDNGTFHYNFETGDGIKAQEDGTLRETNHTAHQVVSGNYEYTAPDGSNVAVSYTADETGYHPEGDVLPTPPPSPQSVIQLLQYLEAHPQIQEHSGEILT